MKTSILRISLIILLAVVLAGGYNLVNSKAIHWNLLNPFLTDGLPRKIQLKIISAPEAFRISQRENIRIIDLRSVEDYLFDHVPNALQIQDLPSELSLNQHIPVDSWLVYDQDGNIKKSKEKLATLPVPESTVVYMLYGGYLHWLANGFPVIRGAENE